MYGASGDVHVRPEVSRACCGLRFVLEALWRIFRVYIYLHLRAELLQLAGVVTIKVQATVVTGLISSSPHRYEKYQLNLK